MASFQERIVGAIARVTQIMDLRWLPPEVQEGTVRKNGR